MKQPAGPNVTNLFLEAYYPHHKLQSKQARNEKIVIFVHINAKNAL